MTGKIGLYIHFPFCRAKCPYCHFASVPFERGLLDRWRKGLELEATLRASAEFDVETLYIGGGTPSLLNPDDIKMLVEKLGESFLLNPAEFTLEANPDARRWDHLEAWRDAGVSRLSIGVQSFDDRILGILGRGYTSPEAEAFVRGGRKAGFRTVGVDLIVGVPTETHESLEDTLRRVVDLGPDHVSLYLLENIEGLPIEAWIRDHPLDGDAAADAYDLMREGLEAAGLKRYEISNFARAGKECLHNLKYWRYEPFLGLGPSACSHLGGRRWCNKPLIEDWASSLAAGLECVDEVKRLTSRESMREALIFGLRLVRGVSIEAFRRRFGFDIPEIFKREIEELKEDGMLIVEGDTVRITDDKFLISNRAFSRFV